MHTLDYILVGLVLACAAFALYQCVKRQRSGKTCGGTCSGCCAGCNQKKSS